MTKKSMPSSTSGARRVKWTRTALRNLELELAYVAQDRPEAALKLVQRVEEAVTKLSEQPSIGRPGRVTGTRELVVTGTSYIIPYRVRENIVEILRVLHSARRRPEGFEGGG